MKLYKLTDENDRTYGSCQWGEGVTHTTPLLQRGVHRALTEDRGNFYKPTNNRTRGYRQWGEGVTHTAPGDGPLCSAAWIHAYAHPILAVLMDPVHGRYGPGGHMWEAEGETGILGGTQHGCTSLTTLRRTEMPPVNAGQRIRFALLLACLIEPNVKWRDWAVDHVATGILRPPEESGRGHPRTQAATFAERALRITGGARTLPGEPDAATQAIYAVSHWDNLIRWNKMPRPKADYVALARLAMAEN